MSKALVLVIGIGIAALFAVARCRAEPPIACNLHAFTREERAKHQAETAKLHAAVRSVTELDDGFALEVDPARFSPSGLSAWAALERRCCPFLRISTRAQGASLELRLEGRPGVKEFLRDVFASSPAATAR